MLNKRCDGPTNQLIRLSISATLTVGIFTGLPTPAIFAQEAGNFVPVVVTSVTGELEDETRKLLVENFTEVIRASTLRSLGREFYGTSKADGFAGASSTGPIGLLRKTLSSMDRDLAVRVAQIYPKLKAPVSGTATNRIELFWTDRPVGTEVIGGAGEAMGLLLKVMGPSVRTENSTQNPFALRIGHKALQMRTATEPEAQGGRAAMFADAPRAWVALREANPEDWVPLHIEAMISLNQRKQVTTRIAVSLLPQGFKIEKERLGDFSIDKVFYQPERDNRSIMRVSLERTYDASALGRVASTNGPLVMRAEFGPLQQNGVGADVCVGEKCLARVDSVPTIHARINASWLVNTFSKVLSLNDVKILMVAVGINVDTLNVEASASELPMVLKTYTFGHKVVDMNRNTRPYNPLEAMQKSLIGDNVTAGLSARMRAEGEAAEKRVNESLQAVVDLFR